MQAMQTFQRKSASTIKATTFTNNFTVENKGPNNMELRWIINDFSSWNNIKVEKYTPYLGSYQLLT